MNNKKYQVIFTITTIFIIMFFLNYKNKQKLEFSIEDKVLVDTFSNNLVLEESSTIDQSAHEDWWVNSGAYFINENGVGKTVQGDINDMHWEKEYSDYNPMDTDNGKHPQNIFRLITKNKWKNLVQTSYYKINRYYLTQSVHRATSNGLLLMTRYQDSDNLYYAGIRVDGNAVIKKKINGEYFTLAIKQIFEGEYNKDTNPNLLPEQKWIGLRSEVISLDSNQVQIKLFLDKDGDESWEMVLDVIDDGATYGGEAILKEGFAGLRTDFMDVEFDNYRIEEKE